MILKYLTFMSLLCAAIYTDVDGLHLSDAIKTKEDMAFIERFVFAPNENSVFEFEIKYPLPDEFSENDQNDSVPTVDNDEPILAGKPIGGTSVSSNVNVMMANNPPTKEKENIPSYKLVIYNDEPGQWPFIRANENSLTCKQRKQIATDGGMVVINLHANKNPGLCTKVTDEQGKPWVHCQGLRTWSGYDRPRWWYTTLQNCGTHPVPGIDALVNITMTNGQGGTLDALKHFSADKTWILPTNVSAMIVLFGMIIISAIFCWLLAKSRLLHVTFKMYFVAVVLQWLGSDFLVAGQADFARDGVDSAPNRIIFGHVLSWSGGILFVLVVILVGKGYTVTRGRISTSGCVKLTIYTMLYCVAYVAVYVHVYILADPRDTMYLYDSMAGYCLIVLRCVGAFWLLYGVGFTVKNNPSKRRFYMMFGTVFSAWFLAEPILIGITNVFFMAHNRAQAVNAGYWAITLAGHCFWLGLFVPCDKNHNFPYTIRTCQIGFYDGDATDQANKYNVDVADDFVGVCVIPKDGQRKPGAPVCVDPNYGRGKPGAPMSPKVNNFFPESANAPGPANAIPADNSVNAETPKPNYSMFLASNPPAVIPKTDSDIEKPKPPKKPRDTPIGQMIEMKIDYSIFQADGFIAATLVVPDDEPSGQSSPTDSETEPDIDAHADHQSFVSIQMEG